MPEKNEPSEALNFSPEDAHRGEEIDKEKEVSNLIDQAIEMGRRQSADTFKLNDAIEKLENGGKEYEKVSGELNRELAALEIEAISLTFGAENEKERGKVLKGFLDLLQREKAASKAYESLYQEMIDAKVAWDKDNADYSEICRKIEEISKEK